MFRILGDDGKFKKEEVVVKKHTFKIGYTFDVSQTEQIEGKEVVELSPVKELEGDVKDYQALTKALMEISPVPITIEAFDGTAKGCYNPLTNEIKIQPEMSEVQTIKTMIHEIAHSIVYSNENLDQLKQKENIEFSKSEREVQAESIAYIVSSHLGIDTSDYSFPYVATWGLSTEPSDLENVKQNLKCIKSTSFDLTSKIDTYMEQLQAQQEQNKVNVQIAINFTREHFETVDTARDVMRVEEKMDELYNNGDISGKTHDEVLNHLSEVEEALYERIKDNMENNFLFKTQVENAVNADGEFGYKRALYNQDDVYKDVVKDVLEIDDLQKDADEMEL